MLHKKLKFGEGGRLAENFTEGLYRKIFELYKIKGKDFDAMDNDESKIEIKASISSDGAVTINPSSEFDALYWLYFDLANDQLIIKKGLYNIFEDYLNDNKSKDRVSIRLKKYMVSAEEHRYKLIKDNKEFLQEIN